MVVCQMVNIFCVYWRIVIPIIVPLNNQMIWIVFEFIADVIWNLVECANFCWVPYSSKFCPYNISCGHAFIIWQCYFITPITFLSCVFNVFLLWWGNYIVGGVGAYLFPALIIYYSFTATDTYPFFFLKSGACNWFNWSHHPLACLAGVQHVEAQSEGHSKMKIKTKQKKH